MAVEMMGAGDCVGPVKKEASAIHLLRLPRFVPSMREKAAGKRAWTAERGRIVSSMRN